MNDEDNAKLYEQLGNTFKQRYKSYVCKLISSKSEAVKRKGLQSIKKKNFFSGHLEYKFLKFSTWEGTEKLHKITRHLADNTDEINSIS